jgi:hypothetical protein
MTQFSPLAFGCVGLKGYGGAAIDALLREQEQTSTAPTARLVAACDVDLLAQSSRVAELRSRGVRINAMDDGFWTALPITRPVIPFIRHYF